MRISITYLYAIFRYGYPPSLDDDLKAFADVRKLGFRFLETEGLGERKLLELAAHRDGVKDALERNGLQVHNFCVVLPELVDLDPQARRRAYELFQTGAELGAWFGAGTLHLASYPPPVEYIEEKPYQLDSAYKFATHARVRIPERFSWQRVWDALVDSCRTCADIAARLGKVVIMEPRVGEAICSVDSLLRLIEHVDRPNFKANFDTAHFCAQRENVPLALAKLEGRFANIHIADNDPANTDHLPVGDGIIDWREFFRVLQRMGYNGYLGLDLGLEASLPDGYRRSVETIRRIAAELGIEIEV
ncbi:MAG: sugar phosphate isomerase/epimerase [Bryobacteraceae bacterium]|nr:sugar phosphate isomerase/epimerase [Bryobacteraceae bacterium]